MIQQQRIEQAVTSLLEAIGEDPKREGLKDTPERVARMYGLLFSGVGVDPSLAIDTVFEADHHDPVVLGNIPFYSLCEHHLLPFFGLAHMAYIPNQKIAGISKLARALEVAARRPQVQERLTGQVAEAIFTALSPSGVAVELEAEHMCMSMRGVEKPGHRVVTTALRGRFENSDMDRGALLALLRRR
ncbi:MAG: GTP cyclohydrolase I FolE [Chloroflexi bacterium]|nr:GTP cyclohydrolase I FolE [Chloroflexota bacterium]MCH8350492.1 GTP cyclohydrolase I FolE [Chloroflexota bacterium]